jgi:hypothetical protein
MRILPVELIVSCSPLTTKARAGMSGTSIRLLLHFSQVSRALHTDAGAPTILMEIEDDEKDEFDGDSKEEEAMICCDETFRNDRRTTFHGNDRARVEADNVANML